VLTLVLVTPEIKGSLSALFSFSSHQFTVKLFTLVFQFVTIRGVLVHAAI
jgi:hypothetical protein